MKSNYKRLGDYIRQVDVRNKDEKVTRLLGVSIDKKFIESIANTIGTDMSVYKIVKHRQFAYGPVTSRNGDKVSIALLLEEECIISSSYMVFEITDTKKLLPEYLNLWFKRPEFDRYARFHSHGSAREIFDWEEMCNVELPVPPIEEQEKIVDAYQKIENRIALKRKINDNLQQQLRTIFRAKFTNNPELERIKKKPLSELCSVVTKGTTPTTLGKSFVESGINFIKAESILDDHSIDKSKFAFIDEETNTLLKRSVIHTGDVVFTIAGTLGRFALIDDNVLPANTNQAVAIIRVDAKKILPEYIYTCFIGGWHTDYYTKRVQQAVQANLSLTTIKSLPIPVLGKAEMDEYLRLILPIIKAIKGNEAQNEKLAMLRDSLLPKLKSGEIDVSDVKL